METLDKWGVNIYHLRHVFISSAKGFLIRGTIQQVYEGKFVDIFGPWSWFVVRLNQIRKFLFVFIQTGLYSDDSKQSDFSSAYQLSTESGLKNLVSTVSGKSSIFFTFKHQLQQCRFARWNSGKPSSNAAHVAFSTQSWGNCNVWRYTKDCK